MLEILAFTWKDLLNPEFYINNGGLWLVLFIVFAETGLFAGFFLPGDSLLFVAGIYSNELAAYFFDTGYDFSNLMMIVTLVTIAGVLGNYVGYWFGAFFNYGYGCRQSRGTGHHHFVCSCSPGLSFRRFMLC